MRCEQIEARINELLDGELSPRRHASMEAHLADCISCCRKHRLMVATRQAFVGLAAEPAPTGFEHRLQQRLEAASAVRPKNAGAGRLPWYVAAAAAALVVLVPWQTLWMPVNEEPGLVPESVVLSEPLAGQALELSDASLCSSPGMVECAPVIPCSNALGCSETLDSVPPMSWATPGM